MRTWKAHEAASPVARRFFVHSHQGAMIRETFAVLAAWDFSSSKKEKPAVCALPSITPIGMAALQPGASSSFSVIEQAGALGAKIDDAFLPDLTARKKFAASRVPRLADIALDELLSLQPSRLAKKIEGTQLIIVRSQEIDNAGERGFTFQARQVMDTVIDNLARAIRKLAALWPLLNRLPVFAPSQHAFRKRRRRVRQVFASVGRKYLYGQYFWVSRSLFLHAPAPRQRIGSW
jgi:hypothetical protein